MRTSNRKKVVSKKLFEKINPKNSELVANKKNNLKDLLLRSDLYNIKIDLQDNTKHGYASCKKPCGSCNSFADEISLIRCFATGRTYKIIRGSTCSTNNVIYMAYCFTCQKQGVGSTVSWKPRLSNYRYKSHI